MTKESSWVFSYTDIFATGPDPDSVLLTIPPEVIEVVGWEPGDVLRCTVENNRTLVLKRIRNEFGDL